MLVELGNELNHPHTFQEAGVALTEEEVGLNEQVFKETIANEFPNEDMTDKTFRDKVIMIIMFVMVVMKMGMVLVILALSSLYLLIFLGLGF